VTYVAGGESDAPLEVTIRCGPVRNRVTLSAHGWEQRVQVDAGASARVSIPALRLPPLGVRTAPIQIRVDEGFVPADVDRTSADRRFLGCRIEAAS
jgi:hypothetical protein